MNYSGRLKWETFVVRMWREKLNGVWRGEIVHVASRASSYFVSFDQAESFISRFAEGIEKQEEETNDESNQDD